MDLRIWSDAGSMSSSVTRSYPKALVKTRVIRLTELTIRGPLLVRPVVMPTVIR